METRFFGDQNADTVLIQPIDIRGLDSVPRELKLIENDTGKDLLIAAVIVDDWNHDMSPWKAPAVFGEEGFGDGAARTLEYILSDVIPHIITPEKRNSEESNSITRKLYLGGYSLAGLFSLWAAYNTDSFDAVAAVSPSVWFPGFLDYVRAGHIQMGKVYLSIGDKEEKVRNNVVSRVGDNLREIHRLLTSLGVDTTLEYNPGNHFRDPEARVSKGFSNIIL